MKINIIKSNTDMKLVKFVFLAVFALSVFVSCEKDEEEIDPTVVRTFVPSDSSDIKSNDISDVKFINDTIVIHYESIIDEFDSVVTHPYLDNPKMNVKSNMAELVNPKTITVEKGPFYICPFVDNGKIGIIGFYRVSDKANLELFTDANISLKGANINQSKLTKIRDEVRINVDSIWVTEKFCNVKVNIDSIHHFKKTTWKEFDFDVIYTIKNNVDDMLPKSSTTNNNNTISLYNSMGNMCDIEVKKVSDDNKMFNASVNGFNGNFYDIEYFYELFSINEFSTFEQNTKIYIDALLGQDVPVSYSEKFVEELFKYVNINEIKNFVPSFKFSDLYPMKF